MDWQSFPTSECPRQSLKHKSMKAQIYEKGYLFIYIYRINIDV